MDIDVTGELNYNIEGSLDEWVPGPGQWEHSIIGCRPIPMTDEGLSDYYEGCVTFKVGIEPITATKAEDSSETSNVNWLNPRRKMRFVKEIKYTTNEHCATQEEAEAALERLVAHLRSTGKMP